MEQEKLEESQKFLQEDQAKFQKLMEDSRNLAKNTETEVKQKAMEKQSLVKLFEEMGQAKQAVETQIKKYEDELMECKKHKHFLDVLAIQAGLKDNQNKYHASANMQEESEQ